MFCICKPTLNKTSYVLFHIAYLMFVRGKQVLDKRKSVFIFLKILGYIINMKKTTHVSAET